MSDEKKSSDAPKKRAQTQKDVANKTAAKKPSTGLIVADGGRYVCIKKCTYGIRMYRDKNDAGGPSFLQEPKGTLIPHHFKKAKHQPEDDDD